MDFTSDNAYGILPEILAAIARDGAGAAPAYGDDAVTAALTERLNNLFARKVAMFPVLTGTAANALALATLVPPHGAVLCHEQSHIMVHECGAPEFFSHGAKLVGLAGEHGKITPDAITAALAQLPRGDVHVVQPFAISLSQPTELGTVYSLQELAAIGALARAHGLKLHLDGARFANALAALGCSPAEATWQCGVDVLCLGASKGGALAAEAVAFFDPADARDFEFRRKKAGHLVSKMRFVSAQLGAFLEKGLWLAASGRANRLAAELADGLVARGVRLAVPVQTNMAFAELSVATCGKLRQAGARFHEWGPPRDGRVVVRLALSFATPQDDVAKFLTLLD